MMLFMGKSMGGQNAQAEKEQKQPSVDDLRAEQPADEIGRLKEREHGHERAGAVQVANR